MCTVSRALGYRSLLARDAVVVSRRDGQGRRQGQPQALVLGLALAQAHVLLEVCLPLDVAPAPAPTPAQLLLPAVRLHRRTARRVAVEALAHRAATTAARLLPGFVSARPWAMVHKQHI
jgi:hypothetical protein